MLSGWRRARTTGAKTKIILQMLRERIDGERNASRGQFDCQGDAVKTAAELCDSARVCVGKREANVDCPRTIVEEAYRVIERQRRQPVDAFTAGLKG